MRLMVILVEMKPKKEKMEDLLSLGKANPFNVRLHMATAIVHSKVVERQLQQNNSNTQHTATKQQRQHRDNRG